MILEILRLLDFRNFRELKIELDGRSAAMCGPNGRGKTNILEAILLLGTTRSHRTRRDPELVRFGARHFHATGEFRRGDGGKTRISLSYEVGARKRGSIDRKEVDRLSSMVGRCGVVLVSPEDVGITGGGPERRRQFLDLTLCSIDPVYLRSLQEYNKVLRHRGQVLREMWEQGKGSLLEPWDRQLARWGLAITSTRRAAVQELAALAEEAYAELGGGEALRVEYQPGVGEGGEESEEEILKALVATRQGDLRTRRTSVGPHRDDLVVELDGRPIRSFGSRGQHRTAVLALKLAAARFMRKRLGEEPILLLDDVFTELDASRSERLARRLQGESQVFATGTVKADLEQHFPDAVHFSVREGGRVVREG